MSYYKVLGLTEEPFSTSPDPDFFYLSREHRAALTRLRIALSLRRGLSVILGDVGTGKTTLSRKLAQVLRDDPNTSFHMILNPYFRSQKQFLTRLVALFRLDEARGRRSALDCIEAVEQFLYRVGVEEQRVVVLLVDEAQLLPDYVLEILRILLNYETNEFKILQLILVGQMELLPRLSRIRNVWDRIALKFVIHPLDVEQTREMIGFRLSQAGHKGPALFSEEAIRLIHQYTRGYPRQLALFCHNCLEALVMHGKRLVDAELVQELMRMDVKPVAVEAGGAPHVF